jgi:hypothetical protein
MRDLSLAVHAAVAVMVLWILFHALGWVLLLVPSDMHEGRLWKPEPSWIDNIEDEE